MIPDNFLEQMGMEPVWSQVLLFCVSFGVGAAAMGLYSLYSMGIAMLTPSRFRRRILFAVCDIFFWVMYALLVFAVFYSLNNARLRLFYYGVMLAGLLSAYNIKLFVLSRKNRP